MQEMNGGEDQDERIQSREGCVVDMSCRSGLVDGWVARMKIFSGRRAYPYQEQGNGEEEQIYC